MTKLRQRYENLQNALVAEEQTTRVPWIIKETRTKVQILGKAVNVENKVLTQQEALRKNLMELFMLTRDIKYKYAAERLAVLLS